MSRSQRVEPREAAEHHTGDSKDAARGSHSAARPGAASRPKGGDGAQKSRAGSGGGSGGQMPQQQQQQQAEDVEQRHPHIGDCRVDDDDDAPRRDQQQHSGQPPSCWLGNTAIADGYEDYSGVWSDLDRYLTELELAQMRASFTRLGATLTGARGRLAARAVPRRAGANPACEETAFF
ncbi:hypothetical protein GGTG_05582 [Gaeumannomyces tritici R3-111a-1]|uniref:Uncharacterized protein n=1 Tax=Gaeumannomyces tritici (strain R3-111a-1) TaxID=644352 RepID=J3NWB8_GAET3|nr:hypothetical protein GGTG_05582 [Gaeumannomyces tritici R3-111a-1]EJT75650.1 hypothetical protein GGTG_05582 [Gaeumannomyces tritici R3-111a-1]